MLEAVENIKQAFKETTLQEFVGDLIGALSLVIGFLLCLFWVLVI